MARKKRDIKILTLDTETIGLDGGIKRIAVYDGVHITYGYCFADVEEVLEDWYDLGYSVHVYIHNLEFDLRKLDGIFRKGNVAWGQSRIIDGKYVKLVCKKYILHDSFRLLPASLAKLSKDFELEHGKLDLWEAVQQKYQGKFLDHVDFLSRCDKDDSLYLEYLGYDVMALYELVYKLADVSGLGVDGIVKCITTASMSKRIFRTGYKGMEFRTEGCEKTDFEMLTSCKAWDSPKELHRNRSSDHVSYQEIEVKLRAAYFGGRTEVFKPHLTGGGFHYDVNSEYPFVMDSFEYPIGFPEYETDAGKIEHIFTRWKMFGSGLGFIKAHVYVPPQHVPPLPAKIEKLVFVTGHVEGWWTYPELQYAMDSCGVEVIEYQENIHFAQTFPVFRNFVRFFYKMKDEGKRSGNAALTQLAKLLLNTAYGWTALRRDKAALDDLKHLEKRKESLLNLDEELGFVEYLSHIKSDTIQVQVAAYVTSYARLVLLKALHQMNEVGEVYYCDTDSIVTSAEMPAEMVDPYTLGMWDLEKVLEEGLFLQPKVYSERAASGKDTIKFKGVSKQAQSEFDFSFYQGMHELMKSGQEGKLLVEKDKQMLRSILYLQKNDKDLNTLEVRDKYLNLGNKQKRYIDYTENYTEPWHMFTLEDFHSFSFAPDYSDIRRKDGTLLNPIA